jgi:hypothetical protein
MKADAMIAPAPMTVVPTHYPDDPGAPLVIRNVVIIDVRSAAFRESDAKLDEIVSLLRGSNEIASDTRDQLIAEITAGRTLLKAPKLDRNLIEILLLRPLRYLADKAGSAFIGGLAAEALHWLLKLL